MAVYQVQGGSCVFQYVWEGLGVRSMSLGRKFLMRLQCLGTRLHASYLQKLIQHLYLVPRHSASILPVSTNAGTWQGVTMAESDHAVDFVPRLRRELVTTVTKESGHAVDFVPQSVVATWQGVTMVRELKWSPERVSTLCAPVSSRATWQGVTMVTKESGLFKPLLSQLSPPPLTPSVANQFMYSKLLLELDIYL